MDGNILIFRGVFRRVTKVGFDEGEMGMAYDVQQQYLCVRERKTQAERLERLLSFRFICITISV